MCFRDFSEFVCGQSKDLGIVLSNEGVAPVRRGERALLLRLPAESVSLGKTNVVFNLQSRWFTLKKLLLLLARPQDGDSEHTPPGPSESDPLLSIGPGAAALWVKHRFQLRTEEMISSVVLSFYLRPGLVLFPHSALRTQFQHSCFPAQPHKNFSAPI